MRKLLIGLLMVGSALATVPAQARDTKYTLKIVDVLNDPEYRQKLGGDISFFFGTQKTPSLDQNLGEFVTNKKTNSFGKSDEDACRWAMLSGLISLKERAQEMGGNAVVNIVSYYKKDTMSSETEYECHAGGIVAGVAFKGMVVKLRK